MRGRVAIGLLGIGTTTLAATALVTTWGGGANKRLSPPPGFLVPVEQRIVWGDDPDEQVDLSSGERIRVRFRFKNVGADPVVIERAETTCDCASPRFQPKTVEPGGFGSLEVLANPIESGERSSRLTLFTDSPVGPKVDFLLTLRGRRLPPYLGRPWADLVYVGDWSADEVRRLHVPVIEPRTHTAQPPELICDLPFISLEIADFRERPTSIPDVVERIFSFEVRMARSPGEPWFHGAVEVVDPWSSEPGPRLWVFGRTPEPVRVIPRRVLLAEPAPGSGSPSATIRVLAHANHLNARIEADHDQIAIQRLDTASTTGATFRLTLDGPQPSALPDLRVFVDGREGPIRIPIRYARLEAPR